MLTWFKDFTRSDLVEFNDECKMIIDKSREEEIFVGTDLEEYYTSNAHILGKDRVKLVEYLRGMRYMAYYLAYKSDYFQAYVDAFPWNSKVKDYLETGKDGGVKYAARLYLSSRVMKMLLACTAFPLYQLYGGYREQALEVLKEEMLTAKSSRDRTTAADRLLFHLKEPENVQVDVSVNNNTVNIVSQCEAMLDNLVSKQVSLLDSNSAIDLVNAEIVVE